MDLLDRLSVLEEKHMLLEEDLKHSVGNDLEFKRQKKEKLAIRDEIEEVKQQLSGKS